MITILFYSLIASSLTMLLNYCMGKPGSKEFSTYEIFSFYSIWLAKTKLKNVGLWDQYSDQYHENLKRNESKAGIIKFKHEFNKMVYDAADPFFTWERAVGMCPVCFGVWVSLTGGIWFTKDFVHLVAIVVISHVTIRLLNKIL